MTDQTSTSQEDRGNTDPAKHKEFYTVEDGWMETASGVMFHFLDPRLEEINIEDIAHALSRTNRYNGHIQPEHYTVGEHSLIISQWAREQGYSPVEQLTALLHDAVETWMPDVHRPLKAKLTQFKPIEQKLDEAVARKFGTIYPFPVWLKEADSRILRDEREQVMAKTPNNWGTDNLERLGITCQCLPPNHIRRLFLRRFEQLCVQIKRP